MNGDLDLFPQKANFREFPYLFFSFFFEFFFLKFSLGAMSRTRVVRQRKESGPVAPKVSGAPRAAAKQTFARNESGLFTRFDCQFESDTDDMDCTTGFYQK